MQIANLRPLPPSRFEPRQDSTDGRRARPTKDRRDLSFSNINEQMQCALSRLRCGSDGITNALSVLRIICIAGQHLAAVVKCSRHVGECGAVEFKHFRRPLIRCITSRSINGCPETPRCSSGFARSEHLRDSYLSASPVERFVAVALLAAITTAATMRSHYPAGASGVSNAAQTIGSASGRQVNLANEPSQSRRLAWQDPSPLSVISRSSAMGNLCIERNGTYRDGARGPCDIWVAATSHGTTSLWHLCIICRRTFITSRTNARYCSAACRQHAYRQSTFPGVS